MASKFTPLVLVVALLASFAGSRPAAASNYMPIETGTIQSLDILKHTLTVNGRTYKVSAKASYVGSLGFSVLSPGMKIRYFLGQSKAGQPQSIVRIIVLPG